MHCHWVCASKRRAVETDRYVHGNRTSEHPYHDDIFALFGGVSIWNAKGTAEHLALILSEVSALVALQCVVGRHGLPGRPPQSCSG